MDTSNGYKIDYNWTDANALTGIAVGQQMVIHNAGRAGDIIEVAVSADEPGTSFRGVAVKSLAPQYQIAPQDSPVWVRYVRYDLNGTITPLPERTCLATIQNIADIQEIGGISANLVTATDVSARVKTEALTAQERAIIEGRFYTGASSRLGITVADTPFYNVLTAGANGLVLDDIIITIDFANTTAGSFAYELTAFVMTSSGNDWSYTPGTPLPLGRSLNTNFINDLPLSTLEYDVIATVNSGIPDYNIYFADYYVDTQGNRNSESLAETSFFRAGRQVIVDPGNQVLVRALITGDATGTADIKTLFFLSEFKDT